MYSIEIVKNQNSLLNQVVITNEKLHFYSAIYPNLGASLQKLSINSIDIIRGISNNVEGLNDYYASFKSAFLFPFPNRISNGKYEFNNTKYELECNEKALNNALHGHIHNKFFSVKNIEVAKNNAKVTLSYTDDGKTKGFPFPFRFEISYSISEERLAIDFHVFNIGKTAFPYGIGWHPYFKTNNLDNSFLAFEAENQYELDSKMIPKGKIPIKFKIPLLMENIFLDDCFILNKPEIFFKNENYNLKIDYSSEKTENFLQIYTPNARDCIAIEPMTCAPNVFNNKNGLQILEPNEKFEWQINMSFQTPVNF